MTDRPYKILVVDDEPDLEPLMLQRMRRSIRSGLYQFVFAHNGIEALECLSQDPEIDMVLSDINMPQMDGLTLLEQIPLVNSDIKSVIISAYGDMKNIRTAMNRGAFDFVTKPVDFEDLQVTIDRTLRNLVEWREALASRDKLVSLQNELGVASQIQQSILPTRFAERPDYQIFGYMEPARNVGGDFFDVIPLENDCVGLAVADVSDKGVPAALFMMSSRTLLKGAAIGSVRPGEVLTMVNEMLNEDNDTSMFVTVFYGAYNPRTGELVYANGGHNSPLLVHSDGSSSLLPLTDGVAVGLVPGIGYKQDAVTLAPGDVLILYTDGVTEAMNGGYEELGIEPLREIFAAAPPKTPKEATETVFNAIKEFVGDTPQSDDITCLVVRRSEAGA